MIDDPVTTEEPVSIRESIPLNVVLPYTFREPVADIDPVN